MNDPDETLKSDTPQPPRSGGPFSVDPVDPLIFKQSNDSPEMRAAAAYIPVANRRLKIRDPKPVKPEEREHDQWTPGATRGDRVPVTAPDAAASAGQWGMRVLTALLVIVPVALILAAVLLGASLVNL